MKRIEIDSLSELKYVAQEVVESLDGRNVVLLRGEMGAGKTTLISRIAAYLGAEDTVTSPTFALVNQYEGSECRIYHFDFYRIEEIEEVISHPQALAQSADYINAHGFEKQEAINTAIANIVIIMEIIRLNLIQTIWIFSNTTSTHNTQKYIFFFNPKRKMKKNLFYWMIFSKSLQSLC